VIPMFCRLASSPLICGTIRNAPNHGATVPPAPIAHRAIIPVTRITGQFQSCMQFSWEKNRAQVRVACKTSRSSSCFCAVSFFPSAVR